MRQRLTAFLARQTPALRSAFVTTLACEVALAVVMTLHLPNPAWALITVFVLATPTAGSSIQKGVLRIVGTVVGAALGIALIACFDQAPLAFSLTLFAICVVASYGAGGGRYPYMYLIGLITVVIVAMESVTTPDRTVSIAFARISEVGIGLTTAVLIRLSVWPVRASAKLRGQLATTLELGAPLLGGEVMGDHAADVVALLRSRQEQEALLQTAGGEGDLTRAQEQRYAHVVVVVGAIIRHVLAADGLAGAAGGSMIVDARAGLAQVMGELAAALRRERGRDGEAIACRIDTLRVDAGIAGAAVGPAEEAALMQVLSTVAAELRALARLVDYLGPGGGAAPPEVDAAAVAACPRVRRFRLDRPRLLHAVKMALVGQTALWLWMVYHLPGGSQGMVSAMLVAQHTVGSTLLKGRLRLLGAVCGGTLGILVASFAIPGVSSLGVFCLLTAPVLFASAWLNDGSASYGYVGFQTGFAFILTLVAGSSPEPNAAAPIFRVCGILIGVGAASLVMLAVAPIDAWSEALRGLGGMLASIARSLSGGDTAAHLAERIALRDQTVAYMAELQDGVVRRGWPRWSLTQLLALESRLGALVGCVGTARPGAAANADLAEASTQLAAAAQRLAVDIALRRAAAGGGEVAAARAAAGRAIRASAAGDVLAGAGALQTAAALIATIEHILAEPASAPAQAEPIAAPA